MNLVNYKYIKKNKKIENSINKYNDYIFNKILYIY